VEITELLRHAVEVGASDLHLKAGNVPFARVDGELSPTAFGAMSAADTEAAALALMPEHKRRAFEATSEADLGYTLAGVGRFRVNLFRQRSMVGLAIRRVRSEVPTVAELMLPPVIAELADSSRGLVLVTGPTGTGKTTTIASMIGYINRTRRAHIVTIEDPIEVVHHDERAIIQQREVRPRHGFVRGGPAARRTAGPRRDLRRRDPRPRVRPVGDPGGGDRSPRDLDDAHDRLDRDDQPICSTCSPPSSSGRSARRSRARSAGSCHNAS
jgi:twitching motility protein PilT